MVSGDVSGVESVEVTFRPLTDEQIEAYVATGEPMDKAGAYGIQGYGAVIVERVHGDYFAVMGLALGLLVQLLGQVGNSGNSSTPHLHFQVLTRPTFFPSDSVPYTFRRFTMLGQAEPFTDEYLALRPSGAIEVTATRPGPRRDELPLDLSVIRFAGR